MEVIYLLFIRSPTENQVNTTFSLHDNPADPSIVTLTTPEGESLTVLGNKNEDGIATAVNALVYIDEFGNRSTTTINPNNGLTDTVTSSDGTRVSFLWSDDLSTIQVTVVSSDGQIQATVNVNLLDTNTSNNVPNVPQGSIKGLRTSRTKRSTYTNSEQQLLANLNGGFVPHRQIKINTDSDLHAQINKRATGAFVTTQVNALRCNEAEPDVEVFTLLRQNYVQTPTSETWSSETTVRAFATDIPGQFEVRIPTPCEPQSDFEESVEDLCMDITDTLQLGCIELSRVPFGADNAVCREIDEAVDEFTDSLPGDVFVSNVFGICSFGFRVLRTHCRFWGNTGGVDAASAICTQIERATNPFLNIVQPTDVFLQPFAIFSDGTRINATSEVITLNPGASGPLAQSFTISSDNTAPEILILTVSPPDPAPFENYFATVQLMCTTPTTFILMEIVGTDGFEDSTTCSGAVSLCVLNVPGAVALVRDVVTVTVTDFSQGSGFQTTRDVAIVF